MDKSALYLSTKNQLICYAINSNNNKYTLTVFIKTNLTSSSVDEVVINEKNKIQTLLDPGAKLYCDFASPSSKGLLYQFNKTRHSVTYLNTGSGRFTNRNVIEKDVSCKLPNFTSSSTS